MVKEKIEEEKLAGGISTGCSNDLVEAYCGVHVGVNLRAAEVKGLNKYIKDSSIDSIGVDLIVHASY